MGVEGRLHPLAHWFPVATRVEPVGIYSHLLHWPGPGLELFQVQAARIGQPGLIARLVSAN